MKSKEFKIFIRIMTKFFFTVSINLYNHFQEQGLSYKVLPQSLLPTQSSVGTAMPGLQPIDWPFLNWRH